MSDEDRSAGRWCARCRHHGSHHTDRHAEHQVASTDSYHLAVVDPDYNSDGVMTSWRLERCECDNPWRHAHGTFA